MSNWSTVYMLAMSVSHMHARTHAHGRYPSRAACRPTVRLLYTCLMWRSRDWHLSRCFVWHRGHVVCLLMTQSASCHKLSVN